VTVLETIQRSTEFLAKKGVESPRLQTELLLAHLLKLPRMRLYLEFERVLSPAEVDAFRGLIVRRGQREPLQHIVGSTSFCGLEISVNRDVLIPRPETELLAERGWTFLNQRSTLNAQPSTALDFGTGSGCLAVMLAHKCPAAEISALDISPEALALARQNAARHGVAERILFLQGDGFAAVPEAAKFDLIISNPPYIPTGEIASLQPEVKDFDPRRALDGGADGLDHGRRLASEAAAFLKPEGRLMLEFGDGQAECLREILQAQMWVVEAIDDDYTHRPRILVARRAESTADVAGEAAGQPG
jgi:release factor glutamine methyltransferase